MTNPSFLIALVALLLLLTLPSAAPVAVRPIVKIMRSSVMKKAHSVLAGRSGKMLASSAMPRTGSAKKISVTPAEGVKAPPKTSTAANAKLSQRRTPLQLTAFGNLATNEERTAWVTSEQIYDVEDKRWLLNGVPKKSNTEDMKAAGVSPWKQYANELRAFLSKDY